MIVTDVENIVWSDLQEPNQFQAKSCLKCYFDQTLRVQDFASYPRTCHHLYIVKPGEVPLKLLLSFAPCPFTNNKQQMPYIIFQEFILSKIRHLSMCTHGVNSLVYHR